MEPGASYSPQSLTELVAYLFARREAILNNWRAACEQDPTLANVATLSREEFNNLIPVILDILEQRLLDKPPITDLNITSQGHGLHRWHKAHDLMETMQELNHLTRTLFDELELFTQLFPEADKAAIIYAHGQIVIVMQEAIYGSLQKYNELQRLQASSRAAALQKAIDQMQEISNERSDMLRTSSHDLRGSVGIVTSAAMLLKMEGLTPEEQEEYHNMLNRSLRNVHSMLTGLMDLSRLEAGQETLQIEPFDAAQILKEIVESAKGMATQKNIILRGDGPDTLMVKTDLIKLRRIIQNILINALKYTTLNTDGPAIVSVSWHSEGDAKWTFSIQDSGPGMPDTLAGIFAEQLRPTVEASSITEPGEAEPVAVLPLDLPQIPADDELARITNHSTKSEGVGLHIVKRLCELLNANLDIESQRGRGTLFRVRLPIDYTV